MDPVDDKPYLDDMMDSRPMCIFTAANLGFLHRVTELVLEEGVNINLKNDVGWTALMYASFCGRLNIVQFLLIHGANCNLQNQHGKTALILASSVGDVAVVENLLRSDCMLEIRDRKNWPALFYAVQNRHDDVVQMLLVRGAAVNIAERNYGYTALMIAAMEGHLSTAILLLNHEADLFQKTFAGDTAESLAHFNGHTNFVRYLSGRRPPGTRNYQELKEQPVMTYDLKTILSFNGLAQYNQVFEDQEIDFKLFLTLNESDLIDIGIKNLGPRKKIIMIIDQLLHDIRLSGSIEHL